MQQHARQLHRPPKGAAGLEGAVGGEPGREPPSVFRIAPPPQERWHEPLGAPPSPPLLLTSAEFFLHTIYRTGQQGYSRLEAKETCTGTLPSVANPPCAGRRKV